MGRPISQSSTKGSLPAKRPVRKAWGPYMQRSTAKYCCCIRRSTGLHTGSTSRKPLCNSRTIDHYRHYRSSAWSDSTTTKQANAIETKRLNMTNNQTILDHTGSALRLRINPSRRRIRRKRRTTRVIPMPKRFRVLASLFS